MTPTFLQLQTRYLDLIGDSDGAIDDFEKRNINAAIRDILNKYQFSWNVRSASLTLATGTATMPNDYNPLWRDLDARIEGSSDSDDNVFCEIDPRDRDSYGEGDYVYWITYDTTTDTYIFNTKTQTGTVTLHYNFIPADLSTNVDICVVPDMEAVCYLAASKHWIGAERDNELKEIYQKDAERYIQALWFRDMSNGPVIAQGTVISYNSELMGV